MQQRGRKSSAAMAVVQSIAGVIDGRPKAPDALTKMQQAIWKKVVASEAADWFKTAALQQMLERYCVHVCDARWLAENIEKRRSSDCDIKNLDRLMKMRERESRAATSLATKLRLTNQSRYRTTTAAVMARNAGGERKIWER